MVLLVLVYFSTEKEESKGRNLEAMVSSFHPIFARAKIFTILTCLSFSFVYLVFFVSSLCFITSDWKGVVRLFKRTGIVLRFLKERHVFIVVLCIVLLVTWLRG